MGSFAEKNNIYFLLYDISAVGCFQHVLQNYFHCMYNTLLKDSKKIAFTTSMTRAHNEPDHILHCSR